MKNNQYNISQNFLTNPKIINRLLDYSDINHGDQVLEIGAGKGHLTAALAARCQNVISYEIDGSLFEKAKERLGNFANVRLLNEDFLKASLPEREYKVFSNIPYSITTEIIKKLTASERKPAAIWLFVEKGTARRYTGTPKETIKSLLLKPFWEVSMLQIVRKEYFHPKPKNDSALICIRRKMHHDIDSAHLPSYERFLRHSFCWGITGRNKLLTKIQIRRCLFESGLAVSFNKDELCYEQWLCLYHCFMRFTR